MTSYVFNRASNEASNGGLHVATSLVKQFVQTLAELEVQFGGQARALKLPCLAWDLAVTQDAEGNGVSLGAIVEHFYDHGDTRELATFFDALQVYAPAEEALDEAAIDAILRLEPTGPAEGHEGMFEAVRDAGYEAMQCIVTGGTLVSLAHPRWDFDQGVIGCNEGIVRFDHASHTTHADAISGRILSHVRSTVTRQNFATIRAQAFPSLRWGQDVDDQIAIFPSEYLALAFSRLASLDAIAKAWASTKSAMPDQGALEFKRESKLTMDKYEENRRFRSANGPMETFETHIWIDQGNRIHFLLDHAERTIEIGYIGKHLPTWKY
jgi:hypothetical protein